MTKIVRLLLASITVLPSLAVAASSSGTGFYVSKSGHVVTNAHVISSATNIKVFGIDGKQLSAKVLALDEANDLALIKVNRADTPGLPLKLSLDVEKGATVFTLGFPNPLIQGFEAKYTSGEISSFSGLGDSTNVMQITTPIQPGNSGGPLIDQSGNVVGVIVSKLNSMAILKKQNYLPENVNFAVKADHVIPLLRKIPREDRIPVGSGRKRSVDSYEQSVVLIISEERGGTPITTPKSASSETPQPPISGPSNPAPASPPSQQLPNFSGSLPVGDRMLTVQVPNISENGCVVPVGVDLSRPISSGSRLNVFVGGQLAYSVDVKRGNLGKVGFRLKVPNSTSLTVECSGCKSTTIPLNISLPCPITTAEGSPERILLRKQGQDLRMLITGELHRGSTVVVNDTAVELVSSLTEFTSKNPYFQFLADFGRTCVEVRNRSGVQSACAD